MTPLYDVKKLYRPEYFQGNHSIGRRRDYFEGWYFKVASSEAAFALIPGVSVAPGDEHAFIQIIHSTGASSYHRFDLEQFECGRTSFEVRIATNRFSLGALRVDLPGFSASLTITEVVRWPSAALSPSSMGWYSFARFMECYHGIIVLDASIEGFVNSAPFSGRFYLEKDWGRSFPEAWVWLQSNTFPVPTSLTCSVARVPFRRRVFTGMIAGLLHEGRLDRFATYNGAALEHLRIDDNGVELHLVRGHLGLRVRAVRSGGAELVSPVQGRMEGRIVEALDASVEVVLERKGRVVFHETGARGGLEIVRGEAL